MKNRYRVLGATVLSVAWFTAGAVTMYATGTQYVLERHSNSEKLSSYSEGFQAGENKASQRYADHYNRGYSSGYSIAKATYKEDLMYEEDEKVRGVGFLEYSGYKFYIQNDIDIGDGGFSGYSFPSNSTILLESNKTADRFREMCNHEVLHQLFPSYDHAPGELKYDDAIYYLEDKLDLSVCEVVTWKAQKLNKTIS
jgi:hypothetical protein